MTVNMTIVWLVIFLFLILAVIAADKPEGPVPIIAISNLSIKKPILFIRIGILYQKFKISLNAYTSYVWSRHAR